MHLISELLPEVMGMVQAQCDRAEYKSSLADYPGLDELEAGTHGLEPGQFMLVDDFPSYGKASPVFNIAQHVEQEDKKPVIIFTLGESKNEIALRLVSHTAQISLEKLRTGYLVSKDWACIAGACGRLFFETHIYIDESDVNELELPALARNMRNIYGQLGLPAPIYLIWRAVKK